MCQIIIKPKGLLTKLDNLDRSKDKNKDGFGVMWYNTDIKKVQVFKTLDYEEFKKVIVESVKEYSAVIHLRMASKGGVSLDNVHPFETSRGALLCHNGTLQSWGNATISDTKEFADTFRSLNVDWGAKATETLVSHTIGTAYNKIVVMMPNGNIKIFNENLFIEEEGIKYSNTCHRKTAYYTPSRVTPKDNIDYGDYGYGDDETIMPFNNKKVQEKFKIFVYGSLKKDKFNHSYLSTAKFLYKAKTVEKFAMIRDKYRPYPYVLGETPSGHQIIGEVYEVDEDTKEVLDILEGVPHHYMEQEIKVQKLYTNGVGYTKDDAIIYTKTSTTKFPSVIAAYDSKLFIEEW